MLGKLNSLKFQILFVSFVVAVVGLLSSYFVSRAIEAKSVKTESVKSMKVLAGVAAESVSATKDFTQLMTLKALNPDVNFVVFQNGKKVFASISNTSKNDTVSTSATVKSVTVVASTALQGVSAVSAEVTAVSATLVLLILAAGFAMSSLLTKALKEPINDAVIAAERIAAGDLSARMSFEGPDELAKFAQAFDYMAERLEESDASQRRFLSDLAHEIATPLNAVSGFAVALTDGTITESESQLEAAWIIKAETERLHNLLQDMRNLDALDLYSDGQHMAIDVETFLGDFSKRFAPQLRQKSISVTIQSSKAKVVVDRKLLGMVIENFLTNAIRYVDPGGAIVLHATEHGHQDLAIGVKDNGIGISADHIHHIFDRLYRVDEARTRESGGSGLGLAIAHSAALSLGGRIEVTSSQGNGSDFVLILPRKPRIRTNRRVAGRITPPTTLPSPN